MTMLTTLLNGLWDIFAIDVLPGISLLNALAWGGIVTFLLKRYYK